MMVLKQMKEANVDPDSGTYFYLIFNSKSEKEIEKVYGNRKFFWIRFDYVNYDLPWMESGFGYIFI